MDRRSFLKQILVAATAPAFIPASRLWLPPEKPLIVLPEPEIGPHMIIKWTYSDETGAIKKVEETIVPLYKVGQNGSDAWKSVSLTGSTSCEGPDIGFHASKIEYEYKDLSPGGNYSTIETGYSKSKPQDGEYMSQITRVGARTL